MSDTETVNGIFGSHKISLILLLVFVIFIYIIMFSVLHKNNETPSGWILVIEIILWITLIIIIIVNIKWLNDKDFNIKAELNDLFDNELTNVNIFATDNDDKPKTTPQTKSQSQPQAQPQAQAQKLPDISNEMQDCKEDDGEVFHVESNTYTYDDAKAICQAYGGGLATYNQIESAYNKGAEWCNYGWSDDQMALFPTQKKTWDKLQTIEGHKDDCGRPGVNGGRIDNANARFGVNCYGYKPIITPAEQDSMLNTPIYPVSMKDKELQRKLEYWKKKVPEMLLSPFNKNSWSILG